MAGYPLLFEPISIRGVTLKNRVVMPPMSTKMMKDCRVTERLIDYHAARAKGGCGLNIIEASSVHKPSAPPENGSLTDDGSIPGYKRLIGAIHAEGGKAGVMLWQGGIAAAAHEGLQIVAPSDWQSASGETIPGADEELIGEITACYGQAARRAVEAGADVIGLHAAHGYLLHSFLSGGINRRADSYGGAPENRMRFPLAVIREIRRAIPGDTPLFLRVNAHDDDLQNGLTMEETIEFVRAAAGEGVDVVEVSRGNIFSGALQYMVPPMDIPYAFNADNAARIREETGVLTMAVGRINGAQLAEGILKQGKADLIGVGRVQLTDPDFCVKAAEGKIDAITRCIGCNQGCFDAHADASMPHITCLRNPMVGKEREWAILPCEAKKTVLIAGGGPAGMEAACTLRERGHDVILCEKTGALGGQFATAGQSPRKGEIKAAMMHKALMTKRSGADVRLGTAVTPELIERLKPDAIIGAAGAYPAPPRIPGADGTNVFLARDVLEGKAQVSGHIAIIGGGMVGLETAEFLAQKGCSVTVLEMLGQVGAGLGAVRRICTMEHIAKRDIAIETGARCLEITGQGVRIGQNGAERMVVCDAVVIAIGARSADLDDVKAYCEANGVAFYAIGDAVKPRRAIDAIAEAAAVAREI